MVKRGDLVWVGKIDNSGRKWTQHRIIQENRQSWILSNGDRVAKAKPGRTSTGLPVCWSDEEVYQRKVVQLNLRSLHNKLQYRSFSYQEITAIAQVIGYKLEEPSDP